MKKVTKGLFTAILILTISYTGKAQLNTKSSKSLKEHSLISTNEFEWNINTNPSQSPFWGDNPNQTDSLAFFTLKQKDMYWGRTNTGNGGYITGYGNWQSGMFFNGVFTTTSHSLGPIATDFLMYRAGWYAGKPHEGNLLYADEEKIGIMSANSKRFFHRVEVDRTNITINSADTLFLNAKTAILLKTAFEVAKGEAQLLAINPITKKLVIVDQVKHNTLNPKPEDFIATKKQSVFIYTKGIGTEYHAFVNGRLVREGENADYVRVGNTITFRKGVKKGTWVQIDAD